jgi:peptidoglycan/xylan/chitin deacetylase (PgdA/CDA1 family)/F0F1-type ATP synthase membrane subunit b/b'
MNKTFKITVDTQKPVQNPSFHVNTNDLRTIHLLMSVQSNGKPVNLEDAQVRIAVLKPDKKTVFQDVVVVDAASGLCEVILDSQAYVVPGEHTAELMIYFVGERVSVTGRFNYRAISGILNDKTVESQNEYQAINKLVLDAETAAQNAKQSENNAKESELVAKQAETNAVNAAANALNELEERTEQFYEQKAAELRAPIDDLSAQLAQKANKLYTETELSKKANRAELDTVASQVDNLIAHAGDTDGNAELLDIRVLPDNIYDTAGEAVRSIYDRTVTSIENLIKNGNFESNTGWITRPGATRNAENNKMILTADGTMNIARTLYRVSGVAGGSYIYVRGIFKATNDDVERMGFVVYYTNGETPEQILVVEDPIKDSLYTVSGVIKLPDSSGDLDIQLRANYSSSDVANGKSIEIEKVMVVNLTGIYVDDDALVLNKLKTNLDKMPWFGDVAKIGELQDLNIQALIDTTKNIEKRTFKQTSHLPVYRNKFDSQVDNIFKFNPNISPVSSSAIYYDSLIRFEGKPTWSLRPNENNAYGIFPINTDLTNCDYIDIYLNISDIDSLGATQIDFMPTTSISSKLSYYPIHLRLQEVKESGWRFFRIPKRLFAAEGGASWSDVNYMRIVTGGTARVNIGKIEAVQVKRAGLYLFFDDGTIDQYENAFRIMEKYGLRGTICVITSRVGQPGYVTWSQLREMEQAGWIVCSHTHTHQRLWNLTDEEVEEECRTSSKILFERGFYFGSKCLVAPYGAYSTRVDRVARKYYSIVRSNAFSDRNNPSQEYLHAHPRHQYHISPHDTDDFNVMKGWADNIIDKKESMTIAFHIVSDTNPSQYTTPVGVFDDFCSYVKQKVDDGVLDVVTWKDTLTQSPIMQPIDNEGKQYIVSDNGEPTILTLQ